MNITVDPCPRCAGRHEHMTFTQMTNAESATFQFWSMCPVKGEPVLVRYRALVDAPPAVPAVGVPA